MESPQTFEQLTEHYELYFEPSSLQKFDLNATNFSKLRLNHHEIC